MKEIVESKKPIDYQVVDKRVVSGRGVRYQMTVDYRKSTYKVDITSTMFADLENNVQPELFYDSRSNEIFSAWKVKIFLRSWVIFSILFIGTSGLLLRKIVLFRKS